MHSRAMVERRQRELVAIYKNRRARIAATRWAWGVRLIVTGFVGLAAGHVATIRYSEAPQKLEVSVLQSNPLKPLPAESLSGSQRVESVTAQAAKLPARIELPKSAVKQNVPASPPGRPEKSPVANQRPRTEARVTASKVSPLTEEQTEAKRGTGVYEAAPIVQSARKGPSFKVIEVPADGVALIQQGAIIKPVRIGERLPDSTILKSAAPDATHVETSGGKFLIDRARPE